MFYRMTRYMKWIFNILRHISLSGRFASYILHGIIAHRLFWINIDIHAALSSVVSCLLPIFIFIMQFSIFFSSFQLYMFLLLFFAFSDGCSWRLLRMRILQICAKLWNVWKIQTVNCHRNWSILSYILV